MLSTDDLRIRELKELKCPKDLIKDLPCDENVANITLNTRNNIHKILKFKDDRLVVVIGPCSIHDINAALEYASRLTRERERYVDDLEIVMRVYFEKPRTTVGWKGLINDPHLDGSFQINQGLKIARKLLIDINQLKLPAGSEFLDVISPQYIADLISWGAIGARTTESQVHRELASGMSCPIGFKNGTDGNTKIAIDAIKAASQPHHFLSVTKQGNTAIVSTNGNEDCHIILRGGKNPNYDKESVENACEGIRKAGLSNSIMIDCSHANSQKKPGNQLLVSENISSQIMSGDSRIAGVMIESHLLEGRQDLIKGKKLVFGQSITDGCINWESSKKILEHLAKAVKKRRNLKKS